MNVLGLAIALSERVALVGHEVNMTAHYRDLPSVSAMEVTGSNLRRVSPERRVAVDVSKGAL